MMSCSHWLCQLVPFWNLSLILTKKVWNHRNQSKIGRWWKFSLKKLCEGHVPKNDWHVFSNYRGTAQTFVFFTASRSHFYIQPEGLWQIMCQGFMMWDVIGPPSWWSKWMCISQWHPHICLAANEHASHGVSHSHWPDSLCILVHLWMQCSSKQHLQPLVFTVNM